jgi:hypothetical protein
MTTIDLTPFCGRDTFRINLRRPWSAGACTYATDGHIGLRVARRPDVAENMAAPPLERIFAASGSVSYRPCEITIPQIEGRQCPVCGGAGWVIRCIGCDGTGRHDCDCEYCDERCRVCDGIGSVRGAAGTPADTRFYCIECAGTGSCDDRRVFLPGGIILRAAALARVLALPGPIEMGAQAPDEPLFFRGPGWTAAVMPMRPGIAPREDDIRISTATYATISRGVT